jgi:peptidoglycan/LPS O-acetylase OafA/YrhL
MTRGAASRLPAIDGLRGLAACSVLFYHVWRYSTPVPATGVGVPALDGLLSRLWVGVTIFFVLSGYLILQPYVDYALGERDSFPAPWRYGESRFLRIVPGYWTALAGCFLLVFHPDLLLTVIVLVPIAIGVVGGRMVGRRIVPAVVVAAACAVSELVLLSPALGATALKSMFFLQIYLPSPTIIGPAWTLCVEATFYLAVPLVGGLIALACRRVSRAARPYVCVGILLLLGAIGPLYRTAMLHDPSLPPALPACVDQFAVGGILAVVIAGDVGRRRLGQRAAWALVGLAAAVLTITLALVSAPRVPVDSTWFDGAVAIAFGLVLLAVLSGWKPGTLLLASRPLVLLGTVSYGVYLWHEPLIHFALGHNLISGGNPWTFLPTALAVLAVTCLVAAAQWRLVEAPSLRLKGLGVARARRGALNARIVWRSWTVRVVGRRSAATARNRLAVALGTIAVLATAGVVAVRVPDALRSVRGTYRLATLTSNTLDRELSTGDAIGFDHMFQLEAVTLIPPDASFAVLGPPSAAAGRRFYGVDRTMFDVLPGYFRELLLPAREVSSPDPDYILCYGCNTTPWDHRTTWLFTNAKGEAIGKVRAP